MKIQEFSINGKKRFRIVNELDPTMVINDAQGYGFKTYEKALAFIERKPISKNAILPEDVSALPLF